MNESAVPAPIQPENEALTLADWRKRFFTEFEKHFSFLSGVGPSLGFKQQYGDPKSKQTWRY